MSSQLDEAVKLVPLLAILVSLLAFLASLRKDRNLRLKEYADRVRKSAALVAARADRWKHLSLSLFQDIQVAITDADIILVKEQDVRRADDFFWRELFIAQRAIAKKLIDEQIEIAYADLFGYDTKIHDLFGALVQRLAATDRQMFVALLKKSQDDILNTNSEDGIYVATELGNRLRATSRDIGMRCSSLMEAALVEFRSEMIKIVKSTDKQIAQRRIAIRDPSEVFAGFHAIAATLSVNKKNVPDAVGVSSEAPSETSQASTLQSPDSRQDLNLPAAQATATDALRPPMEADEKLRSVKRDGHGDRDSGNIILERTPDQLVTQDPTSEASGSRSHTRNRKQLSSQRRPRSDGRDVDASVLLPPQPPSSSPPPPRGGYGEDED